MRRFLVLTLLLISQMAFAGNVPSSGGNGDFYYPYNPSGGGGIPWPQHPDGGGGLAPGGYDPNWTHGQQPRESEEHRQQREQREREERERQKREQRERTERETRHASWSRQIDDARYSITPNKIRRYNCRAVDDIRSRISDWKNADLNDSQRYSLDLVERYGREVGRLADIANNTSDTPYWESQQVVLNAAFEALDGVTLNAPDPGDLYHSYVDAANTLLDIAASMTPGVSVVKDVSEFITGRNAITGERLSTIERAFAGIGVVTLGTSNVAKGGVKALRLLTKAAKNRNLAAKGIKKASKTAVDIINIRTPYGEAAQELTREALVARNRITDGANVYRMGTRTRSQTGRGAQFWSLEHPSTPGHAQRYGIPQENVSRADFIEIGAVRSESQFVTRTAPAVGNNPGGGIEVVVPEGGVMIKSHSSL